MGDPVLERLEAVWRRGVGPDRGRRRAELATVAPSPVVELNRAVVEGRAHGPDAGLAVLAPLDDVPALAGSHLLPAVRADLLVRAGRDAAAATELERAITLARTGAERDLLARRLAALRA